jgi:hypothetical protein
MDYFRDQLLAAARALLGVQGDTTVDCFRLGNCPYVGLVMLVAIFVALGLLLAGMVIALLAGVIEGDG